VTTSDLTVLLYRIAGLAVNVENVVSLHIGNGTDKSKLYL